MHLNSDNLTTTKSLIEDLDDQEIAACVGGCDIQVTYDDNTVLEIPAIKSSFLGVISVTINNLKITYNPNGSDRYLSDRNLKEAVAEVDVHSILKGIADLPITTWKYKKQEDETIRHIGPMAQDFAATFNCGESDRFINAVDANGVALAAIQALYQQLQAQNLEINSLRLQISEMQQQ